jgi:hypothetical protein
LKFTALLSIMGAVLFALSAGFDVKLEDCAAIGGSRLLEV